MGDKCFIIKLDGCTLATSALLKLAKDLERPGAWCAVFNEIGKHQLTFATPA
jgi:hypothetical protein